MKRAIMTAGLLAAMCWIAFASGGTDAAGKAEEGGAGDFVVYWNTNHNYDTYQRIINDFVAEKELDLDFQVYLWPDMRKKLLINFSAGEPVDLIEVPGNWIAEFGANGQVRDITAKINGWPEKSDFLEGTWAETSVGDSIYGVKIHHTAMALFYNKELMEGAGLNPESPPATFGEFKNALVKIKKTYGDSVVGFIFDSDAGYFANFLQSGKNPYLIRDNKIAINNPEAAATMTFLRDIISEDLVQIPEPGANYQASRRLFLEGKVAMMISGPWDIANLANNAPDIDYGIALIPSLEGTEPRGGVVGTGLTISIDSHKEDLSWELIQRLTSLEAEVAATQETGMLMPRKSWATDPRIQNVRGVQEFKPVLATAVPFDIDAAVMGLTELRGDGDLFVKLYQQLLYTDIPAGKILEDFETAGNSSITKKLR